MFPLMKCKSVQVERRMKIEGRAFHSLRQRILIKSLGKNESNEFSSKEVLCNNRIQNIQKRDVRCCIDSFKENIGIV